MSQSTNQFQDSIIVANNEIPLFDLYDDGPVGIEFVPFDCRNLNKVSQWRLKQMIERWPAMKKSWENFIIDYHMCLATLYEEEKVDDDDIPF